MNRQIYIVGRDAVPQDIRLSGGALEMILLFLPGCSGDVNLCARLEGEGAELFVGGLYLCNSSDRTGINIEVRHEIGGCTSRQLFKGVAGGESKFEFNGKIYVRAAAQKTKAYQENHSILLSDTAKVVTCPQLEIYADDVECSHGATIGSLNADEMFYMRSRGIPEKEARALQIMSFLSPLTEKIEDEALKKIVYDYISEC